METSKKAPYNCHKKGTIKNSVNINISPLFIMGKYRKKAIIRRGRRYPIKKRYRKKRPTVRTGFLAVRQTELKTIILPANTEETLLQEVFQAAECTQWTVFNRMFDQYRIKKVTMKLFPTSFTAPTANNRLLFASSIDLDGGTIQDFDALIQCSNAKISPWTPDINSAKKSISLKPRYQNIISRGTDQQGNPIYTTTLGRKDAWIDVADEGLTNHFGLNLGWKSASLATTLNDAQSVQVMITYHLEFRKIR